MKTDKEKIGLHWKDEELFLGVICLGRIRHHDFVSGYDAMYITSTASSYNLSSNIPIKGGYVGEGEARTALENFVRKQNEKVIEPEPNYL